MAPVITGVIEVFKVSPSGAMLVFTVLSVIAVIVVLPVIAMIIVLPVITSFEGVVQCCQ